MYKYYELYNSFDDFFSSILHGNEIEFVYNEKQFYILPYRDSSDKIIGACFGEKYKDNDKICFSSKELYNVCIGNITLNTILSEIEISWYNF